MTGITMAPKDPPRRGGEFYHWPSKRVANADYCRLAAFDISVYKTHVDVYTRDKEAKRP